MRNTPWPRIGATIHRIHIQSYNWQPNSESDANDRIFFSIIKRKCRVKCHLWSVLCESETHLILGSVHGVTLIVAVMFESASALRRHVKA